MIVYWFILIWSFIIGLFWRALPRRVTVNSDRYERRTNIFIALLVFGIIIFFMGLRSGIADTGAYITYFNNLPTSLSEAISTDVEKDKGFYFFSVFVKQFISVDFHVWLFIIAMISGICVMLPLYKYSTMFELSAIPFYSYLSIYMDVKWYATIYCYFDIVYVHELNSEKKVYSLLFNYHFTIYDTWLCINHDSFLFYSSV